MNQQIWQARMSSNPSDAEKLAHSAARGDSSTSPNAASEPEPALSASFGLPMERVVRLVSTTPGMGPAIELRPGINRVGRQRTDNHIVLVSPQISRSHAEIEVTETDVIIRDLDSGNGTFVNGQRIQRHKLAAGDLISFSDKFTLRLMVDWEPQTVRLARHLAPEVVISEPPESERGRSNPVSRLATEPGVRSIEEAPASAVIQAVAQPTSPEQAAGSEHHEHDRPIEDQLLVPLLAAKPSTEIDPFDPELAPLERDRLLLAWLLQNLREGLTAASLPELDALIMASVEQATAFDRGLVAYQLPSQEWKLVMSPKGDPWDSQTVRELLHLGTARRDPVYVQDSTADHLLGTRPDGLSDQRLLLPLWSAERGFGALCLIWSDPRRPAPDLGFAELLAQLLALVLAQRLATEPAQHD